jgi:hypothetical protein
MKNNELLLELIEASESSYSYDRYANWKAVCKFMLSKGFTVEEAATILNSKWTRWAGDSCDKAYGKVTSKDLERFLDKQDSHMFQSLFFEVGLTYRGNYKNIPTEEE